MKRKLIFVCLLTIQLCSDVRASKKGTGKVQSNYTENAKQENGKCECGIGNDSRGKQCGNIEKIIQGDIVKPIYKYPWMVGIFWNGKQNCGAAMIAPKYVLTAAHCFVWSPEDSKREEDARTEESTTTEKHPNTEEPAKRCTPLLNSKLFCPLLLEDVELRYNGEKPGLTLVAKVEIVIMSLGYSNEPVTQDIALVRTVEELPCNKFTAPICLPTVRGLYKANKKVIVAGWGITSDFDVVGPPVEDVVLKEANLILECHTNCQKILEMSPHIVCCKSSNGQACKGDSGGPLFKKVNGRYYLLGLTSYGIGVSCRVNKPTYYTKVKPYLPWIEEKTGLTFN